MKKKSKDERIKDLLKKCACYQKFNDDRKEQLRRVEDFTQMLLKEGRITKEELRKYFPKRNV